MPLGIYKKKYKRSGHVQTSTPPTLTTNTMESPPNRRRVIVTLEPKPRESNERVLGMLLEKKWWRRSTKQSALNAKHFMPKHYSAGVWRECFWEYTKKMQAQRPRTNLNSPDPDGELLYDAAATPKTAAVRRCGRT